MTLNSIEAHTLRVMGDRPITTAQIQERLDDQGYDVSASGLVAITNTLKFAGYVRILPDHSMQRTERGAAYLNAWAERAGKQSRYKGAA